jgi:ATP-binding cassette subfamily B protein
LIVTGLSLVPPLLMRSLIDGAIVAEDIGWVTRLGLAMVAVPLISGAIGVMQRWASAFIGEGIIFDLRRQLYEHLQHMSLGFFTSTRTGELMSRLNNDVVGAQQAVTGTAVTLVSNVIAVVAVLIVMLRLQWQLTLLAVAILPLFIIASRRVGRILRTVRRRQMEYNASMSAHMQETLSVSGALLVKLFARSAYEESRFSENAGQVRDLGVRQAIIGRWFFMALGLASAIGTAAVFWTGAVMVINGRLSVGTIVALTAYLGQLYGPLSGLSNARVEFATSLVSFERVFEVLDLPLDVSQPEDPIDITSMSGAIEFRDVSFSYDVGNTGGLESVQRFTWRGMTEGEAGEGAARSGLALENVSFHVEPGELVALVGPSGAGKTTTTYLVPRLYDVTSGAVLIDGHDVRRWDLDPTRLRTPPSRSCGLRPRQPTSRISSTPCRRVTTRWSANAVTVCREEKSSGWRLPGSSSKTPGSSFSTRQRLISTPNLRR